VPTAEPASDEPIRTRDDLLEVFFESADATRPPRVGPEQEKCGVHALPGGDFAPITYEGELLNILVELAAHHGWTTARERDGGPILALNKGNANVTLEPGGQLELSGAPAADVHAIVAEQDAHMRELAEMSERMGVHWLGVGFHPFARRDELHFVPKARYRTMREYFPTRGQYGLDMMLRTCTVQANLDYATEADAMRKMRLALAIAPLTTAMFANSPYVEGRAFGGVTMRGRVWLDVDDSRTGLLKPLWKKNARFEDYVDWALDAPMFVIKRGDDFIPNATQTFRQFQESGKDGEHATQADWRLHLNTMFPEVRLKRTIEIRSADSQGPDLVAALPALYAGLLYDERASDELETLIEPWTFDEVQEVRTRLWRDGLRTTFRGAPLANAAARLIDIAKGGLSRRARKNTAGRDESVYIEALASLVSRGLTPADVLLASVGDDPKMLKVRVVEQTDLIKRPAPR
jgi:glutamate--cysteine ligase